VDYLMYLVLLIVARAHHGALCGDLHEINANICNDVEISTPRATAGADYDNNTWLMV